MSLLSRKVGCSKTLDLVRLLLQTGNVSEGVSRDSILGSLFTAIYLHELDCFFDSLQEELNFGKFYCKNEEYAKFIDLGGKALRDGRISECAHYHSQANQLLCKGLKTPGFSHLYYIRHKENYLVGLLGARSFADLVFRRTQLFIESELHIVSQFKNSGVFNAREHFYFLGYLIKFPRLSFKQFGMRFSSVTDSKVPFYFRPRVKLEAPVESLLRVLKTLGFIQDTVSGLQGVGLD